MSSKTNCNMNCNMDYTETALLNKGFWLYGNTYGVVCEDNLTVVAIARTVEELQPICDARNEQDKEYNIHYNIYRLTDDVSHYFDGKY